MRWARIVIVAAAFVFGTPLLGTVVGSGSASAQIPKHNCSFCHDLHGGSYNQLKTNAVTEDLCLDCHGSTGVEPDSTLRDGVWVQIPKNVTIHNGLKHLFGAAGSQVQAATTCWDCHAHEGESGSNLYMVQGSMPTPDTLTTTRAVDGSYTGPRRTVVFTSLGTGAGQDSAKSFADGDATYDGVCEVCHSRTNNHGNGQPGDLSSHVHKSGATCTVCHKHSEGFKAPKCTSCHNVSQNGRRPIVPEFERTSHHVDWSTLPNGLAADSIPDATCQVCHDQSEHQQGSVRLKNVDDPSNPAASIVLTGDPLTTQTEADKLAPFCLACHDANGANGDLMPFGDGGSPPVVVTPAAWAGASHNSAGKASCFGCHGSGHGSEKTKLLMPDLGAVSTPDSANVQEGFCFRCHDADGPANVDLATFFSRAINWVQEATGLNANADLNDRHDIQYAAQVRSGAKIECTSCHSPHTLTAQQKYILDPDPGDGHVPGTNYYFYSATADTLSEFCLDCHDGSLPSGVLSHQNYTITNIQATWGADGMGGRTGSSVDLRTGYGWAPGQILPCRVCHTTHGRIDADINVTTLFGVVDTTRSSDGLTYIPWTDRKGASTFIYGITDNLSSADSTSGAFWCNSCHNRYAMTGKVNCYNCHRHGDGGRF